jgi:hypothetical protein
MGDWEACRPADTFSRTATVRASCSKDHIPWSECASSNLASGPVRKNWVFGTHQRLVPLDKVTPTARRLGVGLTRRTTHHFQGKGPKTTAITQSDGRYATFGAITQVLLPNQRLDVVGTATQLWGQEIRPTARWISLHRLAAEERWQSIHAVCLLRVGMGSG